MNVTGYINVITNVTSNVCPTIAGVKPSALGPPFTFPPFESLYPVYECSYNITQPLSSDDITTWKNTFVYGYSANTEYGLDILNTKILPNYCVGSTINCPVDPMNPTGSPLSSCSLLIDTVDSTCRLWAASLQENYDSTSINYCNDHLEIDENGNATYPPECECVLKAYNPVYNRIISGTGDVGPAYCWYIPCSGNGNFYLTPSEDIGTTPCPAVCGVVINNYSTTGTFIPPEDQATISCNLNPSTGTSVLSHTNMKSTYNSSSEETFYKIAMPVILTIVLLIFVGFIIAFSFYLKGRKHNSV